MAFFNQSRKHRIEDLGKDMMQAANPLGKQVYPYNTSCQTNLKYLACSAAIGTV